MHSRSLHKLAHYHRYLKTKAGLKRNIPVGRVASGREHIHVGGKNNGNFMGVTQVNNVIMKKGIRGSSEKPA